MNLSSIIKKYKKPDFSFLLLQKQYKYSTSVQIPSGIRNNLKENNNTEKVLESVH